MTGTNVPSPSPQAASEAGGAATLAGPATAEIDQSCGPAVALFFVAAGTWLLVALLLGLLSSIQLHSAGFLAAYPWLTYGRLYPASLNALGYGFASQIAFGLTVWLLARLGRVRLALSGAIIVGGLFWNIGLVLGVFGILAGDNTGYEWLEIPRYASPILFVAYLLIGVGALVTFHLRRERALYVSQWYLLAALLWFPWIYSTAQLLLVFGSTRGTLQTVVNGWFAHNFFSLWLTPVGLAAVFYFIPKILNRPLHSHYLAMFGFWLLALFGSWGGLHAAEPVPKWITSMSVVTTVLMLVPVLAVAVNWRLTIAQDCRRALSEPILGFIVVGAAFYLVASALEIIGALRTVSSVTQFTFYGNAIPQLTLYGFFGLVGAGAVYYVFPRVIGCDWPSPHLIHVYFWLTGVGSALLGLGLVLGGVVQGLRLQNPTVPFVDVARSIIPFLGLGTLGVLLLIGANLAMLANFAKLLRECGCWRCCLPQAKTAAARPAGGATTGGRR